MNPVGLVVVALTGAARAAAPDFLKAGAFATDFDGVQFGNEPNAPGVMSLIMMPDKGLQADGAVCLDGTDAGFYFSAATDPEHKDDWQIYFQGGGWCYDEMDCYGRSFGGLGSSSKWPKTSQMGGIMSSDCSSNPDFCGFNRVHMAYCDGNSFSGNRDEAVVVQGKPLYFRGRRIMDAVLSTLKEQYGLGTAKNVLLTGCSAGGLATYLHTDYVYQQLTTMAPSMTKFKAAAISGFFLLHNTVENKPVYPTQMKYIFALANSTHGVNDACIAAHPPEDQWRCNFAQEAYAHTSSPTFPLNSALDSWQTMCIYTSELPPAFPNQTGIENGICSSAPGWAPCAGDPEKCSAVQTTVMDQYIMDFDAIMASTPTYTKAGNGAFIHSCHTHCEAQSGAWNTFKVNGVSMQQACSKWWNGATSDPAASNTYTPCLYKTGSTGPRACNPTCRL